MKDGLEGLKTASTNGIPCDCGQIYIDWTKSSVKVGLNEHSVTSALHNQSSQQWQSVASIEHVVSSYKTLRSCRPKSESWPGSSVR